MISQAETMPTPRGHVRSFMKGSWSAANSVSRGPSNHGQHRLEVTAMTHMKHGTRMPYARALYVAAVAALLSACAQTDPPAAGPTITGSPAASSDIPEVVVTASRTQPGSIG
jgi:hypothetical protein